jgi:hypothetical protein
MTAIAAPLRSVRASGELREQRLKNFIPGENPRPPRASLDLHTPCKLNPQGSLNAPLSLVICHVQFHFSVLVSLSRRRTQRRLVSSGQCARRAS